MKRRRFTDLPSTSQDIARIKARASHKQKVEFQARCFRISIKTLCLLAGAVAVYFASKLVIYVSKIIFAWATTVNWPEVFAWITLSIAGWFIVTAVNHLVAKIYRAHREARYQERHQ